MIDNFKSSKVTGRSKDCMNYFDTAAGMNLTSEPMVCHLYEMASYSIKTLQKKMRVRALFGLMKIRQVFFSNEKFQLALMA